MRSSSVVVVALTLSSTLACSALDPPTAPAVRLPTSSRDVALAAPSAPFDISGGWTISPFFYGAYLPGTGPDPDPNLWAVNWVQCLPYAYIEFEEWNSLILKQDGNRITGISTRHDMGEDCWVGTPEGGFVGWFVDIDDTFEGRVEGNAVRLSLDKNMEVRVEPDPNSPGNWIGTIRVRMDPRPYADPFWVEQPFSLSSTTNEPCWRVHLQPPYCIFYP